VFEVGTDECGVCGGNDACVGCDGEPNSGLVDDQCGECGGDNSSCTDCAGNVDPCFDGTEDCDEFLQLDQCGVCDGNDESNTGICDCAGVPNGDAIEDVCGVCNGPGDIYECGCSDNPLENYDCEGNCEATGNNLDDNGYDQCGVCGGLGSLDNCGFCDEDPTNDCVADCNGIWGGDAILDDCGVCTGGNTGLEYNYQKDCAGVCNSDINNDGVINVLDGAAVSDNCGICDDILENDNSSCWFININASITNNSSDEFDITATDNNNVIGMHINANDGWNSSDNSGGQAFNCNDCYVDVPELSLLFQPSLALICIPMTLLLSVAVISNSSEELLVILALIFINQQLELSFSRMSSQIPQLSETAAPSRTFITPSLFISELQTPAQSF
jgi:hypothetical protein